MKNIESGFSLLEVTMAMVISTVVFTGVAGFMANSNDTLNQVGQSDAMTIVKANLQSLLNNQDSWGHTSSKSEFSCLETKTCSGKTPIAIYDANGGLYYDSRSPSAGFSKSGARCSTYPSAECPFHFEVSFESLCDNCASEQLAVDMQIISNDNVRAVASSSDAVIVKNISFCEPGVSNSCGVAGTQICNAHGESYTSCVEPPPPAVASNGGGGGACPKGGRDPHGICESNDQGFNIGPSQNGGR